MNDEKRLKTKLLKKKTMLFWNKQNSLHLLLLLLYLSLFYLKRTTKSKPQTEKKNPTLSSPVSSLYPPCTAISIKRNKKYDNYNPLLTSKITKKLSR